jgi:hypothetical protein
MTSRGSWSVVFSRAAISRALAPVGVPAESVSLTPVIPVLLMPVKSVSAISVTAPVEMPVMSSAEKIDGEAVSIQSPATEGSPPKS